MEMYLVDLVETVHHFYTLKAENKDNAIAEAQNLIEDVGDNGTALSEDEIIVNQCINLNNSEETSELL